MILEKTIQYFKAIPKSILLAAQNTKKKKKKRQKFFAFLSANYSKTYLIKALNSIDASRANGRLVQNRKK